MYFGIDKACSVVGPYAERMLVGGLGASPDSLLRCEPKEDFGGYAFPDECSYWQPRLVMMMMMMMMMMRGVMGNTTHR